MLDGDPNTAWAYRGRDYPKPVKYNGEDLPGRYFIAFERLTPWLTDPKPFFVDELRIMNGYNKSEELFFGNSRAIEIKIYEHEWEESSLLRTVKLSDTPGMKSVRIPARLYDSLDVVISKIERGKVDDLCISEIELRAGGKPLFELGSTYASSLGDSCGCGGTTELRNRAGKLLGTTSSFDSWGAGFSPEGDRYAGIDGRGLWVADARTGRVISRRKAPKGRAWSAQWKANGKLETRLENNSPAEE